MATVRVREVAIFLMILSCEFACVSVYVYVCVTVFICVYENVCVRIRVRVCECGGGGKSASARGRNIPHDSFVLLGRAVAWLYDVCLCMTLLLCVLKFLL